MRYENDDFYIDRVLHGDLNSFAMLIDKHKTMAYNIALRIVKSREDAEEIAQDSFLKAYQSLREFKRESKFTTWMYRIVYNNAISRIRRKKNNTHSFDDENLEWTEPASELDGFESHSKKDQKKLIDIALASLEPDDAVLVTLFYMNDSSVEEISDVTGLGQSNVKVKLYRARKKMQNVLVSAFKNELEDVY